MATQKINKKSNNNLTKLVQKNIEEVQLLDFLQQMQKKKQNQFHELVLRIRNGDLNNLQGANLTSADKINTYDAN